MFPNKEKLTMNTEPVALAGTIQGAITALIALALVFGWVDWSDEQIAAILAAYTALVAVVTTVVRSKVSPVV
jgi:predicted negative regulator of RcsB-dependent stress response